MNRSGRRRTIIRVAAIVVALVVAGAPLLLFWPSGEEIAVGEGDWTMPGGGPSHSSYLTFAPHGPLREQWSTRLEGELAGPAAVAGGRAYVGCRNGFLYCLETDSGRPVWRVDVASGIASMPAVSEAGVIVGTLDGKVVCVNAGGELKWTLEVGGAVSSTPIPDGGRIYFGSSDRYVYCVDAGDGSTLWSFEAEGPVEVSPCVYEGQVYGVSLEGELFALDAKDGRLLWTYRSHSLPVTFPSAADGMVFMASEFEVHCAEAQSGRVLWKHAVTPTIISNLAMRGNQLMVTRGSASVESSTLSLDTRTGDLVWEAACGSLAGRTAIYATNEYLYLGGKRGINTIAVASGIPGMEKELDGILPETLTVTEGILLVGSDSRKVYCFEE
ncbi:MAG: PQQ-binding-like beta-propeller repeat protein [Actinomycetota bacterium]|nr:PQQ-binding-like beta-propeller repeat protein [Actinomycetota bacterium]